jgi:pectinesterase
MSTPTYNVKVAKDGSGSFKTVQAAVDNAPHKSYSRYVIYVKAGVYVEQVNVPSDCWNLMLVGDGASTTIITNDKSVGLTKNMTTFRSGTLSEFEMTRLHTLVSMVDSGCKMSCLHVH